MQNHTERKPLPLSPCRHPCVWAVPLLLPSLVPSEPPRSAGSCAQGVCCRLCPSQSIPGAPISGVCKELQAGTWNLSLSPELPACCSWCWGLWWGHSPGVGTAVRSPCLQNHWFFTQLCGQKPGPDSKLGCVLLFLVLCTVWTLPHLSAGHFWGQQGQLFGRAVGTQGSPP